MIKFIAALLVALIVGCAPASDETKIPLTEEELMFIASQPSVALALEDNRPPYIFIEGGKPQGLAYEYIELIAKKTGLKIRPVQTGSFPESIEALRSGRVDIMTTIRPTPESAEFMGFSPPFAYQGGVFAFRINTLPRSPLTTGLLKGSAAKQYLISRFPDMNLIETADDEESISLLQKGLLDGVVTDEGTLNYFNHKSNTHTRSAIINFDYPYSFAYRRENTTLGSIMAKAVNSISMADRERLNQKWLKEEK